MFKSTPAESPALTLLLSAALVQAQHKRIAFVQAMAHPKLPEIISESKAFVAVQTFKPFINDLLGSGLGKDAIVTSLEGTFDMILMLPNKDKMQSLALMANAFNHLADGGTMLMACENQYGAKSYEAGLKKLAGFTVADSKKKCRLFSAKKTESMNVDLQQKWLEDGEQKRVDAHGLWAQAGLFSWKKADEGSLLLLKHLPQLSGKVMDLCCGYGLLAAEILKENTTIEALHLVEADILALACAKKNLAGFHNANFYHLDAAQEKLVSHMDYVVCNPPFHTGQSRDIELGQTIVRKACGALTHGGQLFLVANRQLPYERILQASLREVECLAAEGGFKVIRGKK